MNKMNKREIRLDSRSIYCGGEKKKTEKIPTMFHSFLLDGLKLSASSQLSV